MIAVSACLAGRACRYDGKANTVQALKAMVERGEAVPICPEVLGGLGIPRDPCERQGCQICTQSGSCLLYTSAPTLRCLAILRASAANFNFRFHAFILLFILVILIVSG